MTRHHLPALAARASRASAMARSTKAQARAESLAPIIAAMRTEGATSLRSLATRLTEAGIAPPRGSAWSHVAVSRILARVKRL